MKKLKNYYNYVLLMMITIKINNEIFIFFFSGFLFVDSTKKRGWKKMFSITKNYSKTPLIQDINFSFFLKKLLFLTLFCGIFSYFCEIQYGIYDILYCNSSKKMCFKKNQQTVRRILFFRYPVGKNE